MLPLARVITNCHKRSLRWLNYHPRNSKIRKNKYENIVLLKFSYIPVDCKKSDDLCQRPIYTSGLMGHHLGPWPVWTPDAKETRGIYTYRAATQGLGLEQNGKAASAEAWLARVACCVVLLLPPRSTFLPNVPLKSKLAIELVDN